MAKGYSNYVDSILDNRMSKAFKSVASLEVRGRSFLYHLIIISALQIYLLAEYVDFFAFGVTALISGKANQE